MKVGLLYSAIMTCLVWAGTPAVPVHSGLYSGEGNGVKGLAPVKEECVKRGILSLENFLLVCA